MKSLQEYINEGFKLGKNKVKKEEDFVNLGLPSKTLWCKYNVGATCGSTAKSWYGDYFMWGDTEPATNRECSWHNYKYCDNDGEFLTKYCHKNKINQWNGIGNPDNKLVLDIEDDMANANMGGDWKMPTKEQFKELLDNTTNEWIIDYNEISGLNGRLFRSKTNDNTLFIPGTGYRHGNSVNYEGSFISIWSSTLAIYDPKHAYYFYSLDDFMSNDDNYRYQGFSVRGVMN